jgi:hypothetical protein
MWLWPIKLSVYEAPCSLADPHRGIFDGHRYRWQDLAAQARATGRVLKRSGCWSVNGYAGIGLQPCSIQPRQIATSLVIRRSVTISSISPRASPAVIGDWEHCAPAATKKAADMSNIYKFSVREWFVPPVLLPIFFVLLIAAAMLIQW